MRLKLISGLIAVLWLTAAGPAVAQETLPQPAADENGSAESDTPIEVADVAPDAAIEQRIARILRSSGWFKQVEVSVSEGIVVLEGRAERAAYVEWAEAIAKRTQHVVAVVNNLQVEQEADWSFDPAVNESRKLLDRAVASLPIFAISLIVLLLAFVLAKGLSSFVFRFLHARVESDILRRFIARGCSIPVFLIGLYIVLNISGLGRLAATVVGGTGLLGLVIGIAFRDITENFLASILISVQRPFRLGDLIEVNNFKGFVQAVTTRGTVLMTEQGNHIQIPNSIIYKEPIINFSANPRMQLNFTVGIGYDASIVGAQSLAMQVLQDHPAVLGEPEPMVLAEELAASTVNLRIYFWVNAAEVSILKVRSSVMRLVKHTFIQNNISMPDDAREVVFPEGIPLYKVADKEGLPQPSERAVPAIATTSDAEAAISTCSEGNLATEAESVKVQARQTTLGGSDANLLKSS